jgi:oxalate decarboxylase/phosphoglucose isomerase-like protein (cupin superfamily)
MKLKIWSVLSLAALWSGVALAQDPVKVDPAHYKVLLENASVRVLSINYPVGATSKMHQHPDAIAIMLGNAKVKFATPDGKSAEQEMANETATYTPPGTHNPTNIGTGPIKGILVEFKAPAAGTATLPASREGMTLKVLAEGPRAMAYRSTASPTFAEPAGSKHDFDQVVIALGDTALSLSIDGKPAKTKWARGDVQFIGRGVGHEAKNTGGKPVDMIIVAIK